MAIAHLRDVPRKLGVGYCAADAFLHLVPAPARLVSGNRSLPNHEPSCQIMVVVLEPRLSSESPTLGAIFLGGRDSGVADQQKEQVGA